ncbi:MAG TPA: SAM-dependent methyltransferase, partial [Accumulibacter sp.]|nr:SAM-dependent methyltransferase [Accumulibacter sp.]
MRFTPALFHHAQTLLSELLRSSFPADLVVSRYFRQHRELGHGDRAFVAETVFSVLRRKRSLSARCAGELTSRRLLLAALACLHGMNRRELDVVLSEAERHWLAQAKAV